MLNTVLGMVRQAGWADLDRPFEKTIYLSRGASLWVILSREGKPETFVKFSRLGSLEVEAARCALASATYPAHAPRFIGYRRQENLHVLASQAEQFRAVTATMTESRGVARAVRSGLIAYFERQAQLATAPVPERSTEWLDQVEAYYAAHELAPVARRTLKEVRTRLGEWRATCQHGDLVMNNLGLRPAGNLIIFDWEDFGAVALPGLDLFTLEFSLEHDAKLARARGQVLHPEKILDIASCCAAQNLSVGDYKGLRLAHALAFLFIKRKYGPEIQGRLRDLIRILCA